MKRNVPSRDQNTLPWYRCPTRGCNCRVIKCDVVESAVVKAMEEWLNDYTVQIKATAPSKRHSEENELTVIRSRLSQLAEQQDHICEYLEKGIYTVAMFTKRNEAIERERKDLEEAKEKLEYREAHQEDQRRAAISIIPTTQHILENYSHLTIPEKNELWKLVLKKVTVYRTPDGERSLHIYPKLPK